MSKWHWWRNDEWMRRRMAEARAACKYDREVEAFVHASVSRGTMLRAIEAQMERDLEAMAREYATARNRRRRN